MFISPNLLSTIFQLYHDCQYYLRYFGRVTSLPKITDKLHHVRTYVIISTLAGIFSGDMCMKIHPPSKPGSVRATFHVYDCYFQKIHSHGNIMSLFSLQFYSPVFYWLTTFHVFDSSVQEIHQHGNILTLLTVILLTSTLLANLLPVTYSVSPSNGRSTAVPLRNSVG